MDVGNILPTYKQFLLDSALGATPNTLALHLCIDLAESGSGYIVQNGCEFTILTQWLGLKV